MLRNILASIFIFPALFLLFIGLPIKFGLRGATEGANELHKAIKKHLDETFSNP